MNEGFAHLMDAIVDSVMEPRDRPAIDHKQDRQFRADAPSKDIPCVYPGCKQKFRKSTQYTHFVAHYMQHHRKG